MAVATTSAIAAASRVTDDHVDRFVVASPVDGYLLQGEVDRPVGPLRGIVVMYPGSGTHTRDVPFSAKGAPRSFLFRDLSDALLRAGFATVRYDERGIRCRPGAKPDDIGRCFDDEDARSISWRTLHSDALAIYRRAQAAAGTRCIVALGHSEGVIHVGALIARHEADPIGVIAIGGPFTSIDRSLRYQKVDLVPRALAAADADHDGIVTRSEMEAAFAHTALSRYGAPDRIPWPKGWSWPASGIGWAGIDALRRAYLADYRTLAEEVLRHADTDAYTVPLAAGGNSVVASYEWEKRFFRPSLPLARSFSGYQGRIAAFFGGIDGNIDAREEAVALSRSFPAARLTISITPDVGHALGDNASYGPMRGDRQKAIVAATERLAASCKDRDRRVRIRSS